MCWQSWLGRLLEEGVHEKSPKCLSGNLGDFGEFAKVSVSMGIVDLMHN